MNQINSNEYIDCLKELRFRTKYYDHPAKGVSFMGQYATQFL